MSLNHILFDLDETLYPASCGLLKAISGKMTEYVANLLRVNPHEAVEMRKNWGKKHGTTLGGLVSDCGFSALNDFLFSTHAVSVSDYLNKDPELVKILSSIQQTKSILTNSPVEHAERVLNYLEIRDQFKQIFDIRFNNFVGKPILSTYEKVLDRLSEKPEQVLFVDDKLNFLIPFKEMGGDVILVDESGAYEGRCNGIRRIKSVKELPELLKYKDES